MPDDFESRTKARLEALTTVSQVLRQARDGKAENVARVLNTAMFLLLVDQDLAEYMQDLRHAADDQRRQFVAKHLATLLYEASEDLPKLLGKDFRRSVEWLSPPATIRTALNRVASDLNRYWRAHQDFLDRIRNAVAAHRDHDCLVYADVLASVQPLEMAGLAAAFSSPLRELANVVTSLLDRCGPAVIAKDILRGLDKARG